VYILEYFVIVEYIYSAAAAINENPFIWDTIFTDVIRVCVI